MLVSPCKYAYLGMVSTLRYQLQQLGYGLHVYPYPCTHSSYYYHYYYLLSYCLNRVVWSMYVTNKTLFYALCLIRRMVSYPGTSLVGSSAPIFRPPPRWCASLSANIRTGQDGSRTEVLIINDNDCELTSVLQWKPMRHVNNYLCSSAQQWVLMLDGFAYEYELESGFRSGFKLRIKSEPKLIKNISCYIAPTCGCWDLDLNRTQTRTRIRIRTRTRNRNQNHNLSSNLNILLDMSGICLLYLIMSIIIRRMPSDAPSSGPSISILIFTYIILNSSSVFKLYKLDLECVRVQQWTFPLIVLCDFCLMSHSLMLRRRLHCEFYWCRLLISETKCNLMRSEGMLFPSDICLVFLCLFVLLVDYSKLFIGYSSRVGILQPG